MLARLFRRTTNLSTRPNRFLTGLATSKFYSQLPALQQSNVHENLHTQKLLTAPKNNSQHSLAEEPVAILTPKQHRLPDEPVAMPVPTEKLPLLAFMSVDGTAVICYGNIHKTPKSKVKNYIEDAQKIGELQGWELETNSRLPKLYLHDSATPGVLQYNTKDFSKPQTYAIKALNEKEGQFIYGYGFFHKLNKPLENPTPLEESRPISEKDQKIFDKHYNPETCGADKGKWEQDCQTQKNLLVKKYSFGTKDEATKALQAMNDAMETIGHHANVSVKIKPNGRVYALAEMYTHSAMGGPGITGTDLTAAANIDYAVKYKDVDVLRGKNLEERNLIRLNHVLLAEIGKPNNQKPSKEAVSAMYAFAQGHNTNPRETADKIKNLCDKSVKPTILNALVDHLKTNFAPAKSQQVQQI